MSTKIFIQTGFCKNLKEGSKLEVFINDAKIEIEKNDEGVYLTPLAQRYTRMWYQKPVDCATGDIIRVESKVGLRGLGPDEKRSFTGLYQVDEGASSVEIKVFGVGFGREFPLLKGSLREVSFQTLENVRINKAQSALNETE
jgi:hypothetical protein